MSMEIKAMMYLRDFKSNAQCTVHNAQLRMGAIGQGE